MLRLVIFEASPGGYDAANVGSNIKGNAMMGPAASTFTNTGIR